MPEPAKPAQLKSLKTEKVSPAQRPAKLESAHARAGAGTSSHNSFLVSVELGQANRVNAVELRVLLVAVDNAAVDLVELEIVDLAHSQFVVVAVAFTSPHKTSSPQLRSRREYLR